MPTEKPKLQEPPRDFESLRSFIIEKREAMPKRLTQVGAYALQNPDEVAFGTAASIASAADVQPSTLVRFAHHLGYEGFSDLQTVFRERLRGRTSSYEERLRAIESEQHDERGRLQDRHPPSRTGALSRCLARSERVIQDTSPKIE